MSENYFGILCVACSYQFNYRKLKTEIYEAYYKEIANTVSKRKRKSECEREERYLPQRQAQQRVRGWWREIGDIGARNHVLMKDVRPKKKCSVNNFLNFGV